MAMCFSLYVIIVCMKRAFEVFLVLIIFYGVYVAFDQAAPVFFDNPEPLWIAITSFLTAIILLVLYSWVVVVSAQRTLKKTVSHLEQEITQKDQEIKSAASFKETVIKEAEETLNTESIL